MRHVRLFLFVASLSVADSARAQDGTAVRQLEAGYGGSRAIETQGFNPATRDAEGNRLVVNGVVQNGAVSYMSSSGGSGADYLQRGASSGPTVTAIGNLVSVNIVGSGNTVVLNARQSTGGDVTASVGGYEP